MTSTNPKVSVIIPTFNRARFLKRAVESVWNQQYEPLEIIIVDDGSTDDTGEVVETLKRANDNILFLSNSRKKGPSGARNTGILQSSGDFIAFLDSDDVWLEHHISEAIRVLRAHKYVDVFFGNFRIVDNVTKRLLGDFFDQKTVLPTLRTEQIELNIKLIRDDIFVPLVLENFFHLGSSVIRRESINGVLFDEDVMFAEDRDFAIRLCRQKKATFAYTTEPVFVLSRHETNLTADSIGSNRSRAEAQIQLFRKYLSTCRLDGTERSLLCRRISRLFVDLSYLHRNRHEYWTAFRRLMESTRYDLFPRQAEELAKISYCSLRR